MIRSIASVFLLALLGACATKPVATDTAANKSASPVASKPANAAAPAVNTAPRQLAAHLDPNNVLAQKRHVYFDFDQYVVKEEFRPVVQAHAKYLDENRNLKIKVEGNADERGSREYNLALGQKRADAVKKQLLVSGVAQTQIETVSWGSEKPKASGHDEAAWSENRRADIKYGDDK